MRIFIETLGCKMNLVDSERIQKRLQEMGNLITNENPDVVIINTCTVTQLANKKSRTKVHKHLKTAKVIVLGCGTKVAIENWKKEFPTCEIYKTPKEVITFFEQQNTLKRPTKNIAPKNKRTRKYIEIQNGCDTYCTYCIIPFARGKSSSRESKNIIQDIQNAEQEGHQEIVLTGINLAAWGASNTNIPEESLFHELLKNILEKTTIPRIRISSVGPQFLSDPFFEVFKSKRLCDHLHISIQSGSDEILKKMKRGHRTKEIHNIAQKARIARPESALTSDIIVGFPGESEKNFEESLALVKELKLTQLHVFPFSPREGTLAAKMANQVPENIKKERAQKLRTISQTLQKDFIEQNTGSKKEVLWEKNNRGLTSNFIHIKQLTPTNQTIEKVLLTKENIVFNEKT